MANGLIGSELQPLDQDFNLRVNDMETRRLITTVVSRNSFALPTETYTTDGSVDSRLSNVVVNSGSIVTLTLPYANYWGSGRSPVIFFTNIGSASATLTCAGSDTINGSATYSLVSGQKIGMVSNGVSAYYIFTSTSITSSSFTFSATDRILGRATAGGGAGEELTCTAAGRALLAAASASAQRTTLGVGTADSPAFTAVSVNHVQFPNVQVASANANALDDYEEGTWTPSDGSGAGLSFSSVTARYTKVGRGYTLHASLTYPSTANGLNATVASSPFTEANFSIGALNYGGTGGGTCAVASGTTIIFGVPGGTVLTNTNMSAATVRFSIPCMV